MKWKISAVLLLSCLSLIALGYYFLIKDTLDPAVGHNMLVGILSAMAACLGASIRLYLDFKKKDP